MKSVGARVETIEDECSGCWSVFNITSWEKTFLENIRELAKLSTRQEEVLQQIETKAGIEPPD